MKKLTSYISMLLLLVSFTFSQNIPDNRKVDWSIAGYEGEIPCASTIRNAVTEFGIDKTGATDVSAAINGALSSIKKGEVLFFPDGIYLLKNTVTIPSNRVIRGESPENTIFKINFASNGTGITVGKNINTGISTSVTAIGKFQEFNITVSNIAEFAVGDDIELFQENDPSIHGIEDSEDLASWAADLKGQLAKISAISGNTITIDRSLSFDYDTNFTLTLNKVTLTEEVGLENFKIIRESNNGTGAGNNNIWFSYVKNSWMRKIHSEYSSRYHFQIDHSRNMEFSEIFMDKAYSCGGGGAGYGLLLQEHVSECLIENSIAKALRHPWIVKEGCVRNVYAYNFSAETTQGDACNADPITDSYADISLHGHYPAYNLFEGNIVYRISSSDAWGPNGPGNTFLRNRVLGVKGIWIQSYSFTQNVIGNELTNANAQFEMNKDNTVTGTTLNYSNFGVNGLLDTEAPKTVESSLYLTSKPSFFGTMPWPSIGPGITFNTGEIPAQKRYNSGKYFSEGPACAACSQPNIGEDLSLCGKTDITLSTNISNSNGYTFQWFKNNTPISTKTTITINEAGTYRVETDSVGCTGKSEITITDILPNVELGNNSIELCDPSEINLESNISDQSYTYIWMRNGEFISNGNATKIDITKAGTYSLTVSAQGCNDVEGEVVITSLLLDIDDKILCNAQYTSLTVNENGEYNWLDRSGKLISKGTTLDTNISETTKFYVEDAAGFSGLVGMKAPNIAEAKARKENRFDRKTAFEVLSKITIDSISIWSGGASSVTVRILANDNNTVLFTKTFTGIIAEKETRLALGKELVPGTYFLDFVGTNGDLYYSYEADLTIQYPYTIDGMISITGSDPVWINDKPYYMFGYNWRVSAGNACAPTAVNITIDPFDASCPITGLEETESFSINPNPTRGLVSIQTSAHKVQWSVKSIEGVEVLTGNGSNINSQNLENGIYFIRVNNSIQKIIKN